MKIEKILIVTDNSIPSIRAVQYGYNLARDIGAKVMLLSVIEPESAAGNPDAGIFPDDALLAIKTKTTDFLQQMEKEYASLVDTEIQVPVGEILPTIIKTIGDWGASLVVAGTLGRTGLSKLFSGNIAEYLIHHSPVPVFVVPMDKPAPPLNG
jgi:nucleotide-binding universal stress UspA family protein